MRDEGILTFYSLKNTALPGAKPKEQLVNLNVIAYYANRTIGFNRMYAAKGADYRLDKLVRAYITLLPEEARYVILEDGRQYRIGDINVIVDEDSIDLSLERLENYYEVIDEPNPNSNG